LTPKDTAYAHFATHDIDEKALENEFSVQVINKALLSLKNQYNLTKTQLRTCITREKISAKSVCAQLKVNCDPDQTK
jgi:hypothetical protein